MTCMAETKKVQAAIANLRANHCVVLGGIQSGFVTVKDNGKIVYRALQKGDGQPWIVSWYNSDRIQWGT